MQIHRCFYDYENEKADYTAMLDAIDKKKDEGKLSEDEYRYLHDRWTTWNDGAGFSIPRKVDLENALKKHFRIIKIKYGTECYSRWSPIYVLKKKGN